MKKLKYLCAGMLALAVVAFVACDDDDEGLNGWTDTAYVYVQGETLGNDMLKQAVVIETEGLEDATPCVYTFRACINKPAKADATVSLTAAASGGIADMLENTMTLCRKPDNSCRAACVRRGYPYDRSGVLSHYRRAENIRSGGFHGDGGRA